MQDAATSSDGKDPPQSGPGAGATPAAELERLVGEWEALRPDLRRALLERDHAIAFLSRRLASLEHSAGYRLAQLTTHALKRPGRLLLLPWRASRLLCSTVLRRFGIRVGADPPPVLGHVPLVHPVPALPEPVASTRSTGRDRSHGDLPAVLFFCVNGAGLGHVTRSLAVARRFRRRWPDAPIIFLTSSSAPQVLSPVGGIVYHLPAAGDRMLATEWNHQLEATMRHIVREHRPWGLLYDGVSPYGGMLNVVRAGCFSYSAVVLRMRHKPGRPVADLSALSVFDEILAPGEAGVGHEHLTLLPAELHALNLRLYDPFILLDREELLTREEVRSAWSVPHGKKVVYVQLGAGNINDIASLEDHLLDLLAQREDVFPVLGRSPIAGDTRTGPTRVRTLRDYPNARFFNGIDLAITAAGYNTLHELLYYGVPAVLVPNQDTVTDDQVARSRTADAHGAAIAVTHPRMLGDAVARALIDEVASTMRRRGPELVPRNGAAAVADMLATRVAEAVSHGGEGAEPHAGV